MKDFLVETMGFIFIYLAKYFTNLDVPSYQAWRPKTPVGSLYHFEPDKGLAIAWMSQEVSKWLVSGL